jgi:hypothetical protein
MEQGVLLDLLARRRDRVIATILGVKDNECDQYLPDQVSNKLRKVILDQINDLYALAADCLESGGSYNELYLDKIEKIYDYITNGDIQ